MYHPGRLSTSFSGGGGRRMLPLLKHVKKRGHRVIMIISTMRSSDQYEVYDDFPIYHVGPNKGGPFKSSFHFSGISLALKTFIRARNVVKTHDIDIIHVFNPSLTCGIAGWITAKLYHKPLVLEFSDLIWNLAIDLGEMNPKSMLTKFGLFVQNSLPPQADMIVATNLIKQMLASKGTPIEKISVIPCGANTSTFHPEMDGKDIRERYGLGDSIVILYQGLVCKAYGIDTLLEAMSKVLKENKKVKLLIVGFHPNMGIEFDQDEEIISLKRKVEQLDIGDKVIFTGPQPQESIPNFIAASDICVNPMPYTLTCRAGSPVKVFEYMAMGKAVVATALESVEDVVIDGKTGLLARSDAEDIANKILWLVENPDNRDKMGRNSREKVVDEFGWDKLGDKLIDVYQQAKETHSKKK